MPKELGSTSRSTRDGKTIAQSFVSFFEGWLVRQEHYLDELLSVQQHCHESTEEDLKELVSRILSHYEQYYEEKSRLVQGNVFLVFSPPWFSSLEQSFFWIAGFKPSLAFRVLSNSVNDLSEDQNSEVGRLEKETKVNERLLADEFAKIQESLASPPLLQEARLQGRAGEDGRVSDRLAVGSLRSRLEAVVAKADLLRTNTVVKVMEILNSVQKVNFLTAVTRLQLRIRNMEY
ncbi:protein RESPONSE TO ABA AND SALT 1 [Ricinus communis]|uniref:Transcription factor HBP-1b, putative n=1 Tax=Ricinus communis TaxID=3988 RepID=B9T1J3_RICCO|nr:protein RESPONSE TO ABA AND SALT 1 [Ricinus communis]EEF30274.1 Transcription factor HBP-1b, putative [Ricinus communis]|eukprot:XP_002532112.1 protein DOG1-like 4 [Ricinus communis]